MARRRRQGFGSRPQSSSAGTSSEPQPPHSSATSTLEQQALKLLQQGEHEPAAQLLRHLISAGRATASVYCNLAAIHGMTGQTAEMIDLLEQALRLRPEYPEALSNLGIAYQENGQRDKAIEAYHRALACRPEYPEALCNLGSALQDNGDLEGAIDAYRKAISCKPDYPEALTNLALAHRARGEHQQAIEACRQALAVRPHHGEALICLSHALRDSGDLEAAITTCQRALALRPDQADLHGTLANLLKRQGQLEEAIGHYRQALQLQPASPELLANLGDALKEQGDYLQAIASFQRALALQPDFPEALSNLGIVHQILDDIPAAIAAYRRAIALQPEFAAAHSNLGISLSEQGNHHAAIEAFREAIRLDPDFAEAQSNLGIALEETGQLEAAIEAYQQALRLQPDYPEAYCNLGNALQEQGAIVACLDAYRKAVELKPHYPDAWKNLSMALLLSGNYRQGWEAYESRFQSPKGPAILNALPAGDPCHGGLPAAGDSLLLVSEQGYGDTLQFMRYVHPLRERGLAVKLCAPSKLHSLIQASGIDPEPLAPEQVHGQTLGPWLPLLSLPRHLGVSPTQPLVTAPYLRTTEALHRQWQDILAAERRPIIAINWQGNPAQEKSTSKGRSLPLEVFAPLARLEGISLLALQKGPGSEQLEGCSFRDRFVHCQDLVSDTWDFLETAAIIANCDLVITSDTSAAHLSAGLGQTTWLLLKHVPEWRWGLEGEDSLWYPSMRLFRQRDPGDWCALLQHVAEALAEALAQNTLNGPLPAPDPAPAAPVRAWTNGDSERAQAQRLSNQCEAAGQQEERPHPLLRAATPEPQSATAHYNLAVCLQQQGDNAGAIEAYRQALALQPEFPEALGNLGVALQAQGEPEEAIRLLCKAVALKPDFADAFSNLGNAYQAQARFDDAIAAYSRALVLRPAYAECLSNLATAHKEKKDYAAAETACRQALALRPDYPEALSNLGNILQAKGDTEAAITCYRQAIKLKPDYANAHYNLGIALKDRDNLEAAITSYQQAIRLKPDYPNAHSNLGNAWQELGEVDKAITAYRTALTYQDDHPAANKNLSMALLLKGDYVQGWARYAWRLQDDPGLELLFARPSIPQWDGSPLQPGTALTLVGEQGLGDVLQFMRYALPLRQQGVAVSLCAVKKLHGLIQASGLDAAPLTPSQAQQRQDGCWLPLLSLPGHLGVTPDDPLVSAPYIHTTPDRLEIWRTVLAAEQEPIIALNWQGNPEQEKTNAKGRSLPLETFAPLAQLKGVRFLSLQKGHGSEQLDTCSFRHRFVRCQRQVSEAWDFLDTAAIIAHCDLVITSDTAVAHLAGGMGTSTWLLLKDVPEWRWGLQGDASFWYPSMRLFRQRRRGDWQEVMQRVLLALQKRFGSPEQSGPSPAKGVPAPSLAATSAGATNVETRLQQAEALFTAGRWQEAEAVYRDLRLAGDSESYRLNRLGQICGLTGRFRDMVDWLEQALRLRPEDPAALSNLGLAYQELGDLQAAQEAYTKSLHLRPNAPDVLTNQGTIWQARSDLEAAIDCYRQALALQPQHADAHCNLGLALQEQGDHGAALASYRQAINCKPDFAQAHYNLACLQHARGCYGEAIESYLSALQIDPGIPNGFTSLGNTYKRLGRMDDAIQAYQSALSIRPDDIHARCNLGNTYLALDDTINAIDCYQSVLSIDRNHAPTLHALGLALQDQGDLTDALAAFQQAVQSDPDFAEAHAALALAQLLTGDYERGWREYEWRFRSANSPPLLISSPHSHRWDGSHLPPDTPLLLVGEQGLGDTLQFIRYGFHLQSIGIHVRVCAQTKLHDLIQQSGLDRQPLTPEEGCEWSAGPWIPLLSLPGLLGVTPERPLISDPYLRGSDRLRMAWQSLLADERRPIVAINWQGDPRAEESTSRGRSFPLETFAPLADDERISLLSLQKGVGMEQLHECTFRHRFVRCQERIDTTWDFLETAAIIANCDLVITSDTAVAHLAAAMGQPTWLLLRKVPEWRWGTQGETTFWYPSMRLFRQSRKGDWQTPLDNVLSSLKRMSFEST